MMSRPQFHVPQERPWKTRARDWLQLVVLLVPGAWLPAHAAVDPFDGCQPTMFVSQGAATGNTPIHTINTTTNPFTFVPFIPLPGLFRHNAIGYNPIDNILYSIEVTPNANQDEQLLRFGSNQTGERVGPITDLPRGDYNSGTFGDDGKYYVRQSGNNDMLYVVDVSVPKLERSIRMTASINSADMAYIDGTLYTIATANHRLYTISPANGAVAAVAPAPGGGGDPFGAMFVAENGLFAAINSGGFYQVDTTTGALTRISSSPTSNNNDGAKCQHVPITFGADLSVTKTNTPDKGASDLPDDIYVPGEERTYTIVVSNSGPFGAAQATVSDPLPGGITEASWTCTGGTTDTGNDVGTCTASGTGAINDAHVGLPVGATVTYLLTLTVPPDFTGDLSNTVTVSPGPATSDTNPGNNTATDTDPSGPVADLWVTKTNTPTAGAEDLQDDAVLSGQQTTYDIVFGNNGPFDVRDALLSDVPESGLVDCALGTPACEPASGTATCPSEGSGAGQLSMANLATASVVVPSMEAGSSIRVQITCTVE